MGPYVSLGVKKIGQGLKKCTKTLSQFVKNISGFTSFSQDQSKDIIEKGS